MITLLLRSVYARIQDIMKYSIEPSLLWIHQASPS